MKKFKLHKYQIISSVVLGVVFISKCCLNSASILWDYQPEIPQELRK